MRRVLPLLVLLISAGAPWARAQVAVPEIGPGSVRVYATQQPVLPSNSIVPENPAALSWGGPSRFAAGALHGNAKASATIGSVYYKGLFGGLRAVGSFASFAAAYTHYSVKYPPVGFQPRQEKWLESAALSLRVRDWLAWGASATSFRGESDPGYPFAAPINKEDTHGWSTGLSARSGEHLYLGGAYGEDRATLNGVFTGVAHRRHGMIGVGLRGGGTLIWHLEADRFRYEHFTDGAHFVRLPGYEMNQYTAEGILGWLMVTYTGYELWDDTNSALRTRGYSTDVGIAPLSGFNLGWRFEHSNTTDSGTKIATQQMTALTVAWLF